MFPYQYALEKMSNAVRILATGAGDARSRLSNAYMAFVFLKIEGFPPDLQADYLWIQKELTKRSPRNDSEKREWAEHGEVPSNINRMQNRTASKIATKIVDLEYHLREKYNEWDKRKSNQ